MRVVEDDFGPAGPADFEGFPKPGMPDIALALVYKTLSELKVEPHMVVDTDLPAVPLEHHITCSLYSF